MQIIFRPAVRVVCLDGLAQVLLLMWRDPNGGELLWEPPGGGIDSGETPLDAARRELTEETGLDPMAIINRPLLVHRDSQWAGRRFVGPEPFFLARYSQESPALSRAGLRPDEEHNLRQYAWMSRTDLAGLTERVEPPSLAAIIGRLDPTGPWVG